MQGAVCSVVLIQPEATGAGMQYHPLNPDLFDITLLLLGVTGLSLKDVDGERRLRRAAIWADLEATYGRSCSFRVSPFS